MNIGVALRIARILGLASARAKSRETGKLSSGTINLILGVVMLLGSAVGAYLIARETGIGEATLGAYLAQFLVVMPSMTTFLCLVYGILFEFNQSAFNVSVDAVNWLPISAADYVLGSTFCTLYFSAPILSILVGATLGLAIFTGSIPMWLLAIVLSAAGAFTGAFTMELIRVFMNRANSSISKRSGRTAVVGRLVFSILIVAVFSSIYNFNVIVRVTAWFSSVVGAAWFFPLIWPSLSVLALINSDVVGAVMYLGLSLLLMVAFFYAGARARAANWVPEPVTLTFANNGAQRAPDKRLLGLTQSESAIVRKDLRGLLRRREMIGFLSFPFIMVLINLLNGVYGEAFEAGAPLSTRLLLFALPGMGLLMLTYFIAATGIGSEGSGFMNLRASPVSSTEVAKAKLIAALIPSLIGLAVILAAVALVLRLDAALFAFIGVFGFVSLMEAGVVGLAIGARYPDYTEVPRARFITPLGSMLGMGVLVVAIGITFGACTLVGFLNLGVSEWALSAVVSAAVGAVITYVTYRVAQSTVGRAYEAAPN